MNLTKINNKAFANINNVLGHHHESQVTEPHDPKKSEPPPPYVEPEPTQEPEKILTSSAPVSTGSNQPEDVFPPPPSDWQDRMNQPLEDSTFFTEPENVLITSNNNHSRRTVEHDTSSDMAITMNEDEFTRSIIEKATSQSEPADSKELVVVPIGDPVEEVITKKENAFGTPTEIYTVGSATQNESTPPSSARHRRVSFDLETSDKDERSSSRSKNKDEALGQYTIIYLPINYTYCMIF